MSEKAAQKSRKENVRARKLAEKEIENARKYAERNEARSISSARIMESMKAYS